jgi:hypothetical protein
MVASPVYTILKLKGSLVGWSEGVNSVAMFVIERNTLQKKRASIRRPSLFLG